MLGRAQQVNRRRQSLSAQANQRISASHSVALFTLVVSSIRPCRLSRPCLPWVVFSQKWLNRDNRAPMPGARRTRRRLARARPGKRSPSWGLLHRLHGQAGHSAPHTRAACLRAQTSSIWVSTTGLGTHVSDHRDCVFPRLRHSWLGLGSATQKPQLLFLATLCRWNNTLAVVLGTSSQGLGLLRACK